MHLNLVPVLFGSGKPVFGTFTGAQQSLQDPRVIEGDRVPHLVLDVRR